MKYDVSTVTFSATLSEIFKIYGDHIKTFLLIAALVWVPATILCTVLAGMLSLGGGASIMAAIAAVLAAMPTVVAFFLQSAATDVATAEACLGQSPSVGSAYSGALRKLGAIIWVSFLYGCIVAIGCMCFVVPGIIFACRYAYALPIVVVEGLPASEALRRSGQLSEGRKGNIFTLLFVLGLLNGIVHSMGNFLFGNVAIPFVGDLLRAAPEVLTAPIIPLALMLDYLSARTAKESFGIEQLQLR